MSRVSSFSTLVKLSGTSSVSAGRIWMDIGYGVLVGYLAGQRCESVRCTKLTSYSRSLRNAVNEHEAMKHRTHATP